MPPCPGCRENQPNQSAHMVPGGCLYDDSNGGGDEEPTKKQKNDKKKKK